MYKTAIVNNITKKLLKKILLPLLLITALQAGAQTYHHNAGFNTSGFDLNNLGANDYISGYNFLNGPANTSSWVFAQNWGGADNMMQTAFIPSWDANAGFYTRTYTESVSVGTWGGWVKYASQDWVNSNFLPLSGGTISKNVNASYNINNMLVGGAALHLRSPVNNTAYVNTLQFTNFNAQGAIGLTYDETRRGSLVFGTSTSTNVTSDPAPVIERMRINSEGNVGIGTVSPQAKLEVSQLGAGTTVWPMQINNPDNSKINDDLPSGTGAGIKFKMSVPYEQDKWAGIAGVSEAPWSNTVGLGFYTGVGGQQERMRISNAGKIGIGTTNPRGLFDVGKELGNGELGSVLARLHEGNGTNYGDGTYLGVKGWGTQPGNVRSFSLEHSFYGYKNSAINFYRGGGFTGGYITFETNEGPNTDNGTEKMIILANGNVGIGTMSPGAKLSVAGNILSNDAKSLLGIYNYNSSNALTQWFQHFPRLIGGNYNPIVAEGDQAIIFSNDNNPLTNQGGLVIAPHNDQGVVGGIRIDENGSVAIGTQNPGTYKLAVNGDIKARKLKITVTDWPDYVFAPTYKLLTLKEVEDYITKYKHLPEVPSAEEVQKDGLDVGGNQAVLLKKIEELTLYAIEQDKKWQETNKLLKEKNDALTERLEKIEKALNTTPKQ